MKKESQIYCKYLEKNRLFFRYKLEALKCLVTGDQLRYKAFHDQAYDCKIWKEVLMWVLGN